jgi:hypothetical protein
VTVVVPTRAAAERAAAAVAPVSVATEAIVVTALAGAMGSIRDTLAAAYEETALAAERREESWREHAEADHAALGRAHATLARVRDWAERGGTPYELDGILNEWEAP